MSHIRQHARDTQIHHKAGARRQLLEQLAGESTCPPPFLGSPPLLPHMTPQEIEAQRGMKGQPPSQLTLGGPVVCELISPAPSKSGTTSRTQLSTSEQSCIICAQAANMKNSFSNESSTRNASNDSVKGTADWAIQQKLSSFENEDVTSSPSTQSIAKIAACTASASSTMQGLCQHYACRQIVVSTKRKGLTNQRLDHEAYSAQSDAPPGRPPKQGSPMKSSRDRDRMLFSPLAPMIDHSKLSSQQKRARLGLRSPMPMSVFEGARTSCPDNVETAVERMLNRRRAKASMVFPVVDVPVARLSGLGDPNSQEHGDDVRFYYDSD